MNLNEATGRLGDHPTIVALHASSSSAGQWAPLASYSAPHVDTVAADLHGHGLVLLSERPGDDLFRRRRSHQQAHQSDRRRRSPRWPFVWRRGGVHAGMLVRRAA